ncbi:MULTISPECIES: carbamoyl phosphate synthase small subunit [Holzapfeliella]
MDKRYLILEDGTYYSGIRFGSAVTTTGELTFQTSNYGYQEAITDPTNSGRILVFTTPILGNAGISAIDYESIDPTVKGVVINQLDYNQGIHNDLFNLDAFLKEKNIPGLYNVDTRSLVRKITRQNVKKASFMDANDQHAFDQIKALVLPKNLASMVSTKQAYAAPNVGKTVIVLDLGIKHSLLRELSLRKINTLVLPFNTKLEEIMSLNPDGVIISNGPGHLKDVSAIKPVVEALMGKVPVMAIGLGFLVASELLGLSLTDKTRIGFYGTNFPIIDQNKQEKLKQTSMNVQQLVQADKRLDDYDFKEVYYELHHQYVAGYELSEIPLLAVAFNPEAAPGTKEAVVILDDFLRLMEEQKNV